MTTRYFLQADPHKSQISFTVGNSSIVVDLLDASEDFNFESTEDRLVYQNIWEHCDLDYELQDAAIKETIRISCPESPRVFRFKISGYDSVTESNENFIFRNDQGGIIYGIKKPFLILANGDCIHGSHGVRHTFEDGIYTLYLGEYGADFYPIIIDPYFVFDESALAADSKGMGLKTSEVVLVGSKSDGSELAFANRVVPASGNSPIEILGSDTVTFNRKVHAKLEFPSTKILEPSVSGIRVTSTQRSTTIISEFDPEIYFSGAMSPVAIFAMEGLNRYDFNITISENNAALETLTFTAGLYKGEDAVTDPKYGTLSTISGSGVERNISYTSPATMPEDETDCFLTIRVQIEMSFNVGTELRTASQTVVSAVQIVDRVYSYEPWSFNDNAKVDPINGDYYTPTSNQGVVVIDVSAGIVRSIDWHAGLTTSDERYVYCANRIGVRWQPESVKGILVCTKAGVFYYNSPTWGTPIFTNKIKVSNLRIVDFVMSGTNIFMLSNTGVVYRIGYLHLASLISGSDASTTIDSLLASADHQPLNPTNLDALTAIYDPASGHLPTRITPISVKNDRSLEGLSTVYFLAPKEEDYWNGFSLMYKEYSTSQKTILSMIYAPIAGSSGIDGTYLNVSNYSASSPDKESQLNRITFLSHVDTISSGPYAVNKIKTQDKPSIVMYWDATKDSVNQFNYPLIFVPASLRNSSRVIVAGIQSQDADTVPNNIKPTDGYHFCPRNISIYSVEEIGPFYNPKTGEEI